MANNILHNVRVMKCRIDFFDNEIISGVKCSNVLHMIVVLRPNKYSDDLFK